MMNGQCSLGRAGLKKGTGKQDTGETKWIKGETKDVGEREARLSILETGTGGDLVQKVQL